MTIRICDRCGDITVDREPCTCATPHDPTETQRRHRAALDAARTTSHREDNTASTSPPPQPTTSHSNPR